MVISNDSPYASSYFEFAIVMNKNVQMTRKDMR